MPSLHRHCALARTRLPSTASPKASSLLVRSIHATVRLDDHPKDGSDDPSKPHSASSSRPQLRSVMRNKAAVNAISSNQASSAKDTIRKFVGGGGPSGASAGTVTDARGLGSNNPDGVTGPLLVRRLAVKPRAGDTKGTSPAAGSPTGQNGTANLRRRKGAKGGSGRGGGVGGGGGGGGRGASRRKRGKSLWEDPDDVDLGDLETPEKAENEEMMLEEDEDDDDISKSKLPPALSMIVEDVSRPNEVLDLADRLKLKPFERAYVMEKLAEQVRPKPYVPSFDPADLIGYGPGAPLSRSMLDPADPLHQALSRAASLKGGAPADRHLPVMAAQEWLHDRTVFLRDDASKKEFDEAAKDYARREREDMARKEGKDVADIPLQDTELLSPKPEDRAAVNASFVAGKYLLPSDLTPKNASDAVRNVYKQLARNPSYSEEHQKSLATRISAMLPALKPTAAPKAAPTRKETAKA